MSLITTNINYSGVLVNEIVKKLFSDSYMQTKWGAKVITAVKGKYVYHDLTSNISLEAYATCPASGTGTATLNQRSKELCRFQMTAEFAHDALIGTYLQSEYSQGYRGEKFNETALFQVIIEEFVKKAAKQWSDIILNGDTLSGTPYLALCDGLLKLWLADANVVDVTAVPGNLVAASVVAEIEKLITNAPKELLYPEEGITVKIGASKKIVEAYKSALYATGNSNFFAMTEQPPLFYKGYEIVPLYHLPDNQMFMTYAENIHIVYDDETDFSRFNITDVSLSDALCDKVTMKLAARAHVDYEWGEFIVWYH